LVESKRMIRHTREVTGALGYMAPEQAAGEHTKLRTVAGVYGHPAIPYGLLTVSRLFGEGTSGESIPLPINTKPQRPHLWSGRNFC